MFNIQGITMGRQMAIELLRCVRTGRWSSHPYLLPDRWSLYRDALASLHALAPSRPYQGMTVRVSIVVTVE